MKKIESLGARLKNALSVAKDTALCSKHSFRHGAVLFRKRKILGSGFNQERPVGWTSWQAHRYEERTIAQHNMHAEISCMHNVKGDDIRGADILVVRLDAYGNLTYSKPCSYCERTMRLKGVRRCWFTIDEEHLGMMEI